MWNKWNNGNIFPLQHGVYEAFPELADSRGRHLTVQG